MTLIRKFLTITWKLYFASSFFLSLIIIYPFLNYYLNNENRFHKAFRLTKAWSKFILFSVGIRYKVISKEKLPPSPYIICSNHTSYLDLILLYAIFPDYFVMIAKKEILKIPFFSIYSRKNMNITVDRENKISSHRAFVKLAEQIDKGSCIGIFPEGTISKTAPKLFSFKSGPFKLAIGKKVPIIPVTFLNNWNLLERGSILKGKGGPGMATIVIDKHIETKNISTDNSEELMQETFHIIENNINQFLSKNS